MLVFWTVALVFGSLALAQSIVQASRVQQVNEETARASEAAARQIEILRSETFSQVFARYNAASSDNPGTGASPGGGFAAASLAAVPGDADGRAGEIVFPVNVSNTTQLSESASGFPGFPRDLNLDGDTSDTTLTAVRVLPVIVRVRWRSAGGGTRSFEIATTLGEP
jgi:hypothetical protein